MENKIAKTISKQLIQNNLIDIEYEDVYVYGLELILSFISSVMTLLTIGIIFNRLIFTVLFLSIFIILRRFTGGYHATTYLGCKVCTACIYISGLVLSAIIEVPSLMYMPLFVFGEWFIGRYAPIENPNKPLTNKKRQCNRIYASISFGILCILGGLIQKRCSEVSNCIYLTLTSVILLMIISILQKGESIDEKDSKVNR